MEDGWIFEETGQIDLEDERLNARLRSVLAQLGKRPTASIPAACGGHADMTAAYRLFDNSKVTMQRILAPHAKATLARMIAQPTVLLVQDTTEIQLTRPKRQVQGAGPLDGNQRRGMLLHLQHAFTPDGTPLGTLNHTAWTRTDDKVLNSNLSRADRAAIPIQIKESNRWLETLRGAQTVATHCPGTQIVSVSDSEADIYEVLAESPMNIDWIVRGCQDRALLREGGTDAAGTTTPILLHRHMLAQPLLYTNVIHVRGRDPMVALDTRGRRQVRKDREAKVEVRSARVTLRPPWRRDQKLPAVEVNVVLVHEVDLPGGEEPIEWMLLTSLPVATADQTERVIDLYCVRWMIEIFFRVLKSGCRVEDRRLENIQRLKACLAVYLIIAWRTLFVCRMARSCPDISCEAIFEPAEWKSVWKVVRHSDPPAIPPRLQEMTNIVAMLGGYIHRKNSPPGPQTIWIGLQRAHDFAICWRTFGPEASARQKNV